MIPFSQKKNSFLMLGFILALILCLICVFYPFISNYLYDNQNSQLIAGYEEIVAKQEEVDGFAEELAACQAYNRLLFSHVEQAVEGDLLGGYDQRLNLDGTGMMGYLQIPGIQVLLPLYHGTGDAVLEAGLGHMEESSLPIGGESTHAVLTGHTGMSGRRLLTDLDAVKIGDVFSFHVLNETLFYQVDQIKIVLPTEYQELRIVEGEDYMTLMTCTPYGVNSHRLLVRGKRLADAEEAAYSETADREKANPVPSTWMANYLRAVWIGAGLFVSMLLAAWWICRIGRRRRRRR